jgi:hypothetical protein
MQAEAEHCAAKDQHRNRPPLCRLPHQVHGIGNEENGQKQISDHGQPDAGVEISLLARNRNRCERNRDRYGQQQRDLPSQGHGARGCCVLHGGLISQSCCNRQPIGMDSPAGQQGQTLNTRDVETGTNGSSLKWAKCACNLPLCYAALQPPAERNRACDRCSGTTRSRCPDTNLPTSTVCVPHSRAMFARGGVRQTAKLRQSLPCWLSRDGTHASTNLMTEEPKNPKLTIWNRPHPLSHPCENRARVRHPLHRDISENRPRSIMGTKMDHPPR